VPEWGHVLAPYWGPSNIRCHSTKYSCLGDLVLGNYAPLLLTHLLALTNVMHIIFGLKSLLLLPCYSTAVSAFVKVPNVTARHQSYTHIE